MKRDFLLRIISQRSRKLAGREDTPGGGQEEGVYVLQGKNCVKVVEKGGVGNER